MDSDGGSAPSSITLGFGLLTPEYNGEVIPVIRGNSPLLAGWAFYFGSSS